MPPALGPARCACPPGDRLVSPSPPYFVWRPSNAAEQAAPDRHQLGVPLARRGARRAALVSAHPWPIGRCSSFPKSIAFSRDRSPQCLAVKARRAESSLRCGPHQPCASSLTASPSLARFFAGDELRKDGGKQGPAQVSAPNQPKPQRAPNLGIRSALKPQGERACRYRHRESTPSFVLPFFVSFRPDKGQELSP